MELTGPIDERVRQRLARERAEIERQEEARRRFESMSDAERRERWKNLVERTQAVIDRIGVASEFPENGRRLAQKIGSPLTIFKDEGVERQLVFKIASPNLRPKFDMVRVIEVQEVFADPEAGVQLGGERIILEPVHTGPSVSAMDYEKALEVAEEVLGTVSVG